MKELYFDVQTALEGLKKTTLDCFEDDGKSLTEWDEENKKIQKKLEEKYMREQNAKEHEKKRQENIKLYREQADELSRSDSVGQFVDLAGEFDRSKVNIDEDAQYRAELNFAKRTNLDMEDE
jgi:hypothetical protein